MLQKHDGVLRQSVLICGQGDMSWELSLFQLGGYRSGDNEIGRASCRDRV